MQVGDKVNVIFTDGHKQQGVIVDILQNVSYNIVVQTTLYGETHKVFCNPESIELIL